MTRKAKIITGVVVVSIICILFFVLKSASFQRWWKSLSSNVGGGIHREVTVYDYQGNVLRTYEGKFDIKESESKVFFDDDNGRRITIYNAPVISEEILD